MYCEKSMPGVGWGGCMEGFLEDVGSFFELGGFTLAKMSSRGDRESDRAVFDVIQIYTMNFL